MEYSDPSKTIQSAEAVKTALPENPDVGSRSSRLPLFISDYQLTISWCSWFINEKISYLPPLSPRSCTPSYLGVFPIADHIPIKPAT